MCIRDREKITLMNAFQAADNVLRQGVESISAPVSYTHLDVYKRQSLTAAQVEEIAKTKMPDLNAASLEAACSMVRGTCRSMGIVVEG